MSVPYTLWRDNDKNMFARQYDSQEFDSVCSHISAGPLITGMEVQPEKIDQISDISRIPRISSFSEIKYHECKVGSLCEWGFPGSEDEMLEG